jgi:hypothetical protein
MFWSVSSISTGLERRIDYWILESLRLECLVVRLRCFLDLGMPQSSCVRSYRSDLHLSNPDWNSV